MAKTRGKPARMNMNEDHIVLTHRPEGGFEARGIPQGPTGQEGDPHARPHGSGAGAPAMAGDRHDRGQGETGQRGVLIEEYLAAHPRLSDSSQRLMAGYFAAFGHLNVNAMTKQAIWDFANARYRNKAKPAAP